MDGTRKRLTLGGDDAESQLKKLKNDNSKEEKKQQVSVGPRRSTVPSFQDLFPSTLQIERRNTSTPNTMTAKKTVENKSNEEAVRDFFKTWNPMDYVPDTSEKPLRDPRANRPEPVGFVPRYPRNPTSETQKVIRKQFDEVTELIRRSQKLPLTPLKPKLPKVAESTLELSDLAINDNGASTSRAAASEAISDVFELTDEVSMEVSEGNVTNTDSFHLVLEEEEEDWDVQTDTPTPRKKGTEKNTSFGDDPMKGKNSGKGKRSALEPVKTTPTVDSAHKRTFGYKKDFSTSSPGFGKKIIDFEDDDDREDLTWEPKFSIRDNSVGIKRPLGPKASKEGERESSNTGPRKKPQLNKLAVARVPSAACSNNEQELLDDFITSRVQCPMCDQMFTSRKIEEHAFLCQGGHSDDVGNTCCICFRNIPPQDYEMHVQACLDEELSEARRATKVEIPAQQELPNTDSSSEKTRLKSESEEVSEVSSAGDANISTFVPLKHLQVKLFDFKNQFPSGDAKPKANSGTKRKSKKQWRRWKRKKK